MDDRLSWIVDELVNIFIATDVADIMHNFGKSTKQEDPVIHFYETFLAAYNPALRKSRGVWYTPQPVVNFIVRAVDDILKTEFSLPLGLADTSKTKITLKVPTHDKRYAAGMRDYEQEVHKVQILDPATGTGTFLSEVVRQIHSKFKGQQGIWSKYVTQDLIPRLNGFEILMASYAMAHLKMDMLLTETGYKPLSDQRFRIFLTNSLEEAHPDTRTLFSSWLSDEADQANLVKKDTPVMVIIGNPPYSGESANKGEWIMKLMEDYKKEPGGKIKLKEQNSKFINDDYVKFLRFGQYYIERNGEGILAFINPHGFLDNPTFRGMRWNLLKAYDAIYTIDLHGNSKKQEVANDGTVDQNVFDIMQGVSINLFIKTAKKQPNDLAKVMRYDLYGKRNYKNDFLVSSSLKTVPYTEVKYNAPNYFFQNKDAELQLEYAKGFSCKELFVKSVLGFQTHRDPYAIDFEPQITKKKILELRSTEMSDEEISKKYLLKDTRDWKLSDQRKKLRADQDWESKFSTCLYRPFDFRSCYLSYVTMDYPRKEIIANNLNKENISLLLSRQQAVPGFQHAFITKVPAESCVISNKTKEQNVVFPLYDYSDNGLLHENSNSFRRLNFNPLTIEKIAKKLKLKLSQEESSSNDTYTALNLIDYIYAILYSQNYREKYEECLQIDIPHIPYPDNIENFRSLCDLGSKLRSAHLLEFDATTNLIEYPIDGTNIIENIFFNDNKIFINEFQYFGNIEESVWNKKIGSYEPSQKWLKDRKGKELSFEDIQHFQSL